MCTAISFHGLQHYFGRNLDLDYHYKENVTVIPRKFPLGFRFEGKISLDYAIIGMATVDRGYPLLYDATNEFGLSMAGLNFPQNAVYQSRKDNGYNIAPFELIPWVLRQCKNVGEAVRMLSETQVISEPYSSSFPLTPLHWLLADNKASYTIEPMQDGLQIIKNPIGVLTNSPPFRHQMWNLANYMHITRDQPTCLFSDNINLTPYSLGMGAIGLPGDLSSASRFVRAAYVKLNSPPSVEECTDISQFFHVLGSVEQQDGACRTAHGFEKTIYTSCCNTEKGIYYYSTYDNRQINAVDMHKTDLNCAELKLYPLVTQQNIRQIN